MKSPREFLEDSKIGNAASIIGCIAVLFGVAYYIIRLEDRIGAVESKTSTLQNQLLTLKVAPKDTEAKASPAASSQTTVSQVGTNPLIQTCNDLYHQVEDAIRRDEINQRLALNGYMDELHCAQVLQAQAPK